MNNYQYPQYPQYPNNYPQYPNQQYSPPQQNQLNRQNQSNGMIWVQGEEGAKAYLVGAGNSVVLWDSEAPIVYIKSADMSGMPSMRVLEWKEKCASKNPVMNPVERDYITREEFDDLVGKVNKLFEGGEKNNVPKKQSE